MTHPNFYRIDVGNLAAMHEAAEAERPFSYIDNEGGHYTFFQYKLPVYLRGLGRFDTFGERLLSAALGVMA